MSKKSKLASKIARRNAKRARRDANRARYAGLVGTAANRKKKKARTKVSSRVHASPCGNLACTKCYVEHNDPWNAPRGSCLYGKRFSSPKHRNRG